MSDLIIIVIVITLSVSVILTVGMLTYIVVQQMLLFNELNKRLLVMAKEAIENERIIIEEFESKIAELEARAVYPTDPTPGGTTIDPDDDEPFDPHNAEL